MPSGARQPYAEDMCARLPTWVARPLTSRLSEHRRLPEGGTLHVWRFQSHWLPVSSAIAQSWLSADDWREARRHASPFDRRRFIMGCAALRWLAGGLLDVDAAAVHIDRAQAETTLVSYPRTRSSPRLCVDIAYAGNWILLCMAGSPLGVGAAMPTPSNVAPRTREAAATSADPDDADAGLAAIRVDARSEALRRLNRSVDKPPTRANPGLQPAPPGQASQHTAAEPKAERRGTTEAAGARERLLLFDLPMPGHIAVSVASFTPVSRVRAFGWRAGESFVA